jgi:hypothetical protein
METLRVQRDAVEEMWGRLADIAAGTFQRGGTFEMSKVPDGFLTVLLACTGRPQKLLYVSIRPLPMAPLLSVYSCSLHSLRLHRLMMTTHSNAFCKHGP